MNIHFKLTILLVLFITLILNVIIIIFSLIFQKEELVYVETSAKTEKNFTQFFGIVFFLLWQFKFLIKKHPQSIGHL